MKVVPYNKSMAGESENVSPASGFIGKLWHLVNCESTNNHIRWTENGDGFHITNGAKLAEEILPVYFKHNNISSFVRQLNMYGFRKVNRPETGLARMNSNDLQFTHPNFHRDKGHLLRHIHRKNVGNHRITNSPISDNMGVGQVDIYRKFKDEGDESGMAWDRDLNQILARFDRLKQMQEESSEMINTLRNEKEKLRMQVERLMENCTKNNFIINQLINIILPRMSNEQKSHLHLNGLTKRQITASEEEHTAGVRFDDLSPMTSDEGASSSRHVAAVDGQRPAKVRRAVVIPSAKSVAPNGATPNFQTYTPAAGVKRRRAANSSLVIEELKDEQVLHSKPPAQRPLRVMMPTGKTGIPISRLNAGGRSPHLTIPLDKAKLDEAASGGASGGWRRGGMVQVARPAPETPPHLPLLRTPSLTMSMPLDKLGEMGSSISPDPLAGISPFGEAVVADVADVTDHEFGHLGSIMGGKDVSFFDDGDKEFELGTSSRLTTPALELCSNNACLPNVNDACEAQDLNALLAFDSQSEKERLTKEEPPDMMGSHDELEELLLSPGQYDDSPMNSPASPPLLAPSQPLARVNVAVVQAEGAKKKLHPALHIR